jgi:alcohol dehydrogenase class IV
LASVVSRRQAKRVLIVGDSQLQSAGVVSQVELAVQQTVAQSETFTGGQVEPTAETVQTLVDAGRQFKPDLLVAVGGGSNMDLAKGAAAILAHDGDLEHLFGHDKIPGPTLPLVCLPTTAGTGSEVSHSAVFKHPKTSMKTSVQSQYLRPQVAIVDPQLTLSCPARVTAESGMDALTHAIEAYLVANFYAYAEDFEHGLAYEGNHPLGDLYAEKAIELIGKNLQRVIEDPDHLASRSGMAFAATLAGAAFSSCGVCLVHALEYPTGAMYGSSHGVGNAILLPNVMRFWLPERQTRLARIASLLGVPNVDQMTIDEAAEASIEAVEYLRSSISLPMTLTEIGAKQEDIVSLSDSAMSLQRLIRLSPRPTSKGDIENILKASL